MKGNLIDHGFMDARIKLIDVCIFRSCQRHGQTDIIVIAALKDAINELQSDEIGRVAKYLIDSVTIVPEPIDKADIQGAFGAPDPNNK